MSRKKTTHVANTMKHLLVFFVPLLILGAACRAEKQSVKPLLNYSGTYGTFVVCPGLATTFVCPGDLCKNGTTAFRETMGQLAWTEFQQAIRTDRTSAPIAGVVEQPGSGDRNSKLDYRFDDLEYSGTALNYDAFSIRMTQYVDEVISSRDFQETDPTLVKNPGICSDD